MKRLDALLRLSKSTQACVGTVLLLLAVFLLIDHGNTVRLMRDVGLPAAVELPALEQRMRVLDEQNQIVELQEALATGSAQEKLNVYVLPETVDPVRPLAALDIVVSQLQQKKQLLSMSPISVEDMYTTTGALMQLPVTFSARVTKEGWKNLVLFTKTTGLMSVGDAFSETEFKHLLSLTEQENPATIAALEQFFATDFLRYVEEPRPFNTALLQSFSSESTIQTIRAFIDGSSLRSIRELFSPMAATLRAQRMWPLPFMRIEKSDQRLRDDGTLDVTVTILVYGRKGEGRGRE